MSLGINPNEQRFFTQGRKNISHFYRDVRSLPTETRIYDTSSVKKQMPERVTKSLLDIIIMSLMVGSSMSGYDILRIIYERFKVLLSPGTIYPMISTLEVKGLVRGKQNENKRLFTLTDEGKDVLRNQIYEYGLFQMELEHFWRSLNDALGPRGRS